MKIHKAGYPVILVYVLISLIIITLVYLTKNNIATTTVSIALFLLLVFILRFFRFPKRKIIFTENQIIAPADGKIVVIEEIDEKEYCNEKRIQVSIFMSVWNVHINWFPSYGKVKQSLHFNGRYMAAWLPKASYENERSVVIIEPPTGGDIVVKQIAGAVARRVITYAKPGDIIVPGQQMGFIRFGSRVDVLLPTNYKIKVQLNQKAVGGKTILAEKE